jgi:X-X-X-Leu-X-X-Gly heptad repeat protein
MRTLELYLSGALALVLVYLLVTNASGANQVLDGLGRLNTGAVRALQGR